MYKPWRDVRLKFNKSTHEYDRVDPGDALKGLTLKEAVWKQGWAISDVFNAIRRVLSVEYHTLLRYCDCEMPMSVAAYTDLTVWYDIKQACDDLGIEWDGWKDLPELPDDDDF